MYIDDDQTIYIADTLNHRIMKWKNGAINGQIVAGGKGTGNRNHQM
jgi:sugar lactone lactonase YvrE